ncbi:L-threonylcarbamoyladenylate synthase [Chitinivorax sp. B]|uniref:L-threonylcarbamoyladenylate synthase n=1 Tax=Chitinivorax sp. B TaxID=2502235 RepID=UPI0010F43674|nr:L-threonylcarbamoyladenylate synthase [Chitinivorax sp. B]
MAQFFSIHPDNPQARLIGQAVKIIRDGGVIVYPTDSCYAIGCQIGNKEAVDRIRHIRDVDDKHHFTLVCRDLSELATYARVDNAQFRLLKSATPGCYTFLLMATKEVPRRLQHPKRNTIGLRVPQHSVVQALLAELGEPLLSSTLMLPGDEYPQTDPYEIRDLLEHQVDLVLDGGYCGMEPTTVVDLTENSPVLVRKGNGNLKPFGLEDV